MSLETATSIESSPGELELAVDDFLAHYGVKGMKWGVRRDRDGSSGRSSNAGVIAKKTAQSLTVVGAAQVGRILGSAGGTVIGGPGIGTMVGAYTGSFVAGRTAQKMVYGDVQKKRADAKKNLPSLLPERNSAYSDRAAKQDIGSYGPDGAQRINRSMNEGKSLTEARASEKKLNRTVTMISVGGAIVQTMALNKAVRTLERANSPEGRAKMHAYASKKGAERAARKSALKFTKPGRDGVYKVTTLKR